MAQTDSIDAAQEMELLPDWGRGSIGGEWSMRRLRRIEPWAGAALVVAAPQALCVALVGFAPFEVPLALVGSVLPAIYVIATVLVGPDLPPWSARLWLFSKATATTMAGLALTALASAGLFGLFVVIPALPVAVFAAVGTGLVRRGFLPGAVLGIAAFSVLGAACTRPTFDGSGYDHAAVHGVGFAAFSVAAIMMVLLATATVGACRARHHDRSDEDTPDLV